MRVIDTMRAAEFALQSAIVKSVETGKIDAETIRLALRLMPKVRDVLKADIRTLEACTTRQQIVRVERAAENAGDVALAKAVLGVDK